ncbi:hypothetical protein AsAng_0058030 [Aureispira anguillae]|uniref:Uncharacterized protein n=1 Tax=Aureispira anguillae TaxID=2864201 RepID=A0A916DW26_9BACT|nr:hypothetical protein AsAng_0058030 [Aureispira anguillae]
MLYQNGIYHPPTKHIMLLFYPNISLSSIIEVHIFALQHPILA